MLKKFTKSSSRNRISQVCVWWQGCRFALFRSIWGNQLWQKFTEYSMPVFNEISMSKDVRKPCSSSSFPSLSHAWQGCRFALFRSIWGNQLWQNIQWQSLMRYQWVRMYVSRAPPPLSPLSRMHVRVARFGLFQSLLVIFQPTGTF